MNFEEMRRRLIRAALRSFFRTTETRLQNAKELPKAEIRRILICRPNHRLGNLLLLTPLIVEMQRVFPVADVDIVLAGEHGPDLFRTFGNVKHIYGLSRRMVRHPLTMLRTLLRIRRARYDLAVDPCEASQSSRFLLAWSKAKYVIGIPRGESIIDSSGTTAIPPRHMAKWPVFLLRRALQDSSETDLNFPILTIGLTSDERRWGRQVLHTLTYVEDQPPVRLTIGLFADATGSKRYKKDWWLRFIGQMRTKHPDCAIVEIAPPDGFSRLASRFPSFSSSCPREVAAVISNMTCFISADCGVMHLACASETPTIGLFSVTDVSKYEPYGPHRQAIATNGKSPEELARLISAIVEVVARDNAIPFGPPTVAKDETRPANRGVVANREQRESEALPAVGSP